MSRETGGYAFPIQNADFQTFLPSTVDEYKRIQSGMTLRDYFAAKAMQGRLANPDWLASDEKTAADAYQIADAMLKAREVS